MGAHAWLVRHVTFPVEHRGTGVLQRLRELERTQWLAPDTLREQQAVRLRRLVSHAYARSLFYRERFDAARVRPEDVRSLDDLARLPVLEKRDLRAASDRMLTVASTDGLVRQRTSGSTGVPLDLWVSPESRTISIAANLRVAGWWGIAIGDRRLSLVSRRPKRAAVLAGQFLLRNRLEFPATDLSERRMQRLHWWITRGGVRLLVSYPSPLEYLARYIEARGVPTALRAVGTLGELLTDRRRSLLRRAFGCVVYDDYGTAESGHIAGECREGRKHVAEHLIVEYLPHPETGGSELVITELANLATPLIRYRVGDLGVPGAACPCGRGLPVVRLTAGRTVDLIVLPDGRRADFALLARVFDDLAALGVPIHQYRVVQHAPDRFEVILAGPPSLAQARAVVRQRVREAVAAPASVAVTALAEIPPQPSGKQQRFVPLPNGAADGR